MYSDAAQLCTSPESLSGTTTACKGTCTGQVAASVRSRVTACAHAGITIGKRYARTDELGVPFAITVDYDTVRDGDLKDSVTLRERDSMEQVRVPVAELVGVLRGLCENVAEATSWQELKKQYPVQEPPADA